MKRKACTILLAMMCFLSACAKREGTGCLVGAFLSDAPSAAMIDNFKKNYGKKPFFVLIFLDWGKYPEEQTVREIYGLGCALIVTWEPWDAASRKGIDYNALLDGKDDEYIRVFASKLKAIGQPVFLRFAHEMNGNWYPWAGTKIGWAKYQRLFRHMRKVFNESGVSNVRWIFSINAENVPADNAYTLCYPGDRYVDYVGLDGYNWGNARPGSQWRSFEEIFSGIYHEVVRRYQKPVILSEFSATSAGGDKARWIDEALRAIRKMPIVKGFVLFNMNKETDWRFQPDAPNGQKLKEKLASSYFQEAPTGDL